MRCPECGCYSPTPEDEPYGHRCPCCGYDEPEDDDDEEDESDGGD